MKKILVLGGTSFFGRELVQRLINNNHSVTIFSRGRKTPFFDSDPKFIIGDRKNLQDLKKIDFSGFDIVFDQIGFCADDSKLLVDAIGNAQPHLVFTSSQSVYNAGENLKEDALDPNSHRYDLGNYESQDYGEAKRQAEAYYFQKANFPVSIIRPSIVFGPDDKTGRFQFHVNKISRGKPFFLPNRDAKISMLYSKDAAKALEYIGLNPQERQVYNLSTGELSLQKVMRAIANGIEGKINLLSSPSPELYSPYGATSDWWMNREKIKSILPRTEQDLIKLIEETAIYEDNNQSES
ncbi:MAG: NAD-dependent epimerase/dehydratase family protein [Bdellovibrio sp.]